MWLKPFRHFVRPPESVYGAAELEFMDGCHTYGEYNYLRPGLVSRIKTAHFEAALELTRPFFGRCNVIDFGCADGVFLPSLARHFDRVWAVDRVPHFVEVAERVVAATGCRNVELLCNEDIDFEALKASMPKHPFGIAFCLETVEHVGVREDLYASKIEFLRQLFALVDESGKLVISVPKMVGLPFLVQRAALALWGIWREPMTTRELLRAGLLRDTRDLEDRWDGGHLGFNHLRLEEAMQGEFRIDGRADIVFQLVYLISRV